MAVSKRVQGIPGIPSQMAFVSAVAPYIEQWRAQGLTWKEVRDRVCEMGGCDISVEYLQVLFSKVRRDNEYQEAIRRVLYLERELFQANRRVEQATERIKQLLMENDSLRRGQGISQVA